MSGTATAPGNPGADYALTPSATSVTILANFASADITLTPVDDSTPEPTETAILTLSSDPAYTLAYGFRVEATVNNKLRPAVSGVVVFGFGGAGISWIS